MRCWNLNIFPALDHSGIQNTGRGPVFHPVRKWRVIHPGDGLKVEARQGAVVHGIVSRSGVDNGKCRDEGDDRRASEEDDDGNCHDEGDMRRRNEGVDKTEPPQEGEDDEERRREGVYKEEPPQEGEDDVERRREGVDKIGPPKEDGDDEERRREGVDKTGPP